MLAARERSADTLLCVGLDPVLGKLPDIVEPDENICAALRFWGIGVADATSAHALAFKPNLWHWLSKGIEGLTALIDVVAHIRSMHRTIPVVLDAKVGDIGPTCEEAARLAFDVIRAHAVTATPYVGLEALRPLYMRPERGVILVDKTSNVGADEFQDVTTVDGEEHTPLYLRVAREAAVRWNADYGNFALVAGATKPSAVGDIRRIVGDAMPLLVPGFGAQGGSVRQVIPVAVDSKGGGVMANASSSIGHASNGRDYEQAAERAARTLKEEINRYRPRR